MTATSLGSAARAQDGVDLERLLEERGGHLMRAAIALTSSREEAEDLLQAAIERLLRHWRLVHSDHEGYLRSTLYNLAADGWRRRGTRHAKLPLLAQPHQEPGGDPVAAVDLRDALVRGLRELPPFQRAVLVLRYWEQLSHAEAADVLGCAEGTVRAAASRGLRRLRELAATWDERGGEGNS